MTKDLEHSLSEVYDVKRDPELKRASKEQLSKRMSQAKKLKSRAKWHPLFAVITLCTMLFFLILTLPTGDNDEKAIHTSATVSVLVDERPWIQNVLVAETRSEHYFAARNPSLYIGVLDFDWGSDLDWPKSLEIAMQEARPVSRAKWNHEQTDIRDIKIEYYAKNQINELRLKVFYIDQTNLVYMKGMDSGQWYEVRGESAENLQMYRAIRTVDDIVPILFFLGMGSMMLAYLIGLLIRDKNPILKRTKRFINNRHKVITLSVRFLVIGIVLSNLYLLGVVNITVAFLLVTIMFMYPLYMELRYRKEMKCHYIVITQYIIACLYVAVICLLI
ncbi:hypothetical protein JFL43_16580 [Viridibacillus sp. YIM B01967]|uniref:Uncharacterized protein n=1 Tax=Viridibacillus soli TaxID=2798301 RepID=A0ABS1HAK6_9BACL|nr:hypothetical protein [Viridibacillus soli]MBK3496444.1 hypothetical protein [Viridibacillus soli]